VQLGKGGEEVLRELGEGGLVGVESGVDRAAEAVDGVVAAHRIRFSALSRW
jgi:hypothetical protein